MPAGALFCRDAGEGPPIVVLHGGPEFDHAYLLPELDRLADSFRLVSYDQRGRGRSADGVRSELDDLDRVRRRFGLEPVAVLGHSWGGVVAMAYAIRHPDRVTQQILLDTAPASAADWQLLREAFARRRPAADAEAMQAIAATDAYRRGDLETEAAYYRIHFRMTLRGEHDFIPVELAARVADAVPGARLTVLPGCGHFTYLEARAAVFAEIDRFCGRP